MIVNHSKIISVVGVLLILLDVAFFYNFISNNISGVWSLIDILVGDLIFFGALECFWRGSQGSW